MLRLLCQLFFYQTNPAFLALPRADFYYRYLVQNQRLMRSAGMSLYFLPVERTFIYCHKAHDARPRLYATIEHFSAVSWTVYQISTLDGNGRSNEQ